MRIDFEQLFATSPNPYVVLDRDLAMVWMNGAYLAATMRSREDLLGRPMFEAFPSDPESDSYRLLSGSFARVLASGEADEIALIRYDIQKPDGSMDTRFWSATHTPLHDEQGQAAFILQHTVDVTELHGLRRLRDEMGLVQRASAVQARNRDLADESQKLRKLFEQAPGFVAVLGGPDHVFQMANKAYRTLVGERDLIGKPVAEALPEVIEQGFVGLLDRVYSTGVPYVGERERIVLAPEQGDGGETFLDFIYQPIFTDEGDVSGIFVQGHEVTDQVRAEQRQKLLIDELNHRVKNTLAIVQGLAAQSFRGVPGAEGARATFDGRLHALAAAHSLLTARNWESAHLLETIRSSVEATAGSDIARFHLQGPDFSLRPQTAVSLAMVVHELSTNAIKYGALSQAGGSVAVGWTIGDEGDGPRLAIDWTERGGPPVSEPASAGFGTRLINQGMAGEKGGSVSLEFRPEGMHCRIGALLPRAPA